MGKKNTRVNTVMQYFAYSKKYNIYLFLFIFTASIRSL